MSVRLNVLMIQSPAGNKDARYVSEAVVGELIGLAGLDLTLIDRLDQLDPDSTDQLTMESITGDVAVLAWQPVAVSLRSLMAIGFEGYRAAHHHDLEAAESESEAKVHSRRIYLFDLHQFDSEKQLCAALAELLASRQIRTFTLSGTPRQVSPAANLQRQTEKRPGGPNDPDPPVAGNGKPEQTAADFAARKPSRQPLDLDDLVDQLDQLDP